MPEYLRRFREGLTEPTRFEGGETSRGALGRRVLAGIQRRDTADLAKLLVSRGEFAWLVFPEHLYARPPYELDPAIFWMQLTAATASGLEGSLRHYGGKPMALLAVTCERDTLQIRQGPITAWSKCGLRYRSGDSVVTHRLFGTIVERDGRMKLMSLASEF
ncbi:MAG: hypothetical protein HOP28_09325 [Gemmatimonadales bacterium]|nr:hypothetical protein [Gemmatimonadales bacterium]